MAGSTSFGQLMQLGHVVPNLTDAIQYWLDRGVGPFYEMTHVRLAKQLYRGEPTDVDMGVALSYSGPIQIELIVQHNDVPSLYRDFLAERPQGGLHHVAFATARLVFECFTNITVARSTYFNMIIANSVIHIK